jgi:putative phage-type endonuclease
MLLREGLHLPAKMPMTGMPKHCLLPPLDVSENATIEEHRIAWLLRRRNSLGASDIPVVLEESDWTSRYNLWGQKTGLVPIDPVEMEFQRFGHRMEPVAHEEMEFRYPQIRCVDPKGMTVQHPVLPYLTASVDRMLFLESYRKRKHLLGAGWIPLEVKSASEYKKGEWGPTWVPRTYYVQVQAQMAVTGRPVAVLAAIIGGNRMKVYTIYRDEVVIGQIVTEARAFWQLVQSNIPPAIDGHKSTTEALVHKYPKALEERGKEIPDDMLTHASRYLRISKLMDRLKERKDLSGNLLRDWMGTDGNAVSPTGVSVLFYDKKGKTVDTEKMLREHPEYTELALKMEAIEEAYSTPAPSRVLTVKKRDLEKKAPAKKEKAKAKISSFEPELELLSMAA